MMTMMMMIGTIMELWLVISLIYLFLVEFKFLIGHKMNKPIKYNQ